MNKTVKTWMIAAILVLCGASMASCGNKTAKKTENHVQTENPAQIGSNAAEETTFYNAIDDYLVNEIGKNYDQGDVCIPYSYIVCADQGNPNDILVWGDFWVFNYALSGDTLNTTSGGNHPGLMHVRKTDKGFEVTSFEAVADGSDNLPSAKRIFGEHLDAFLELSGDADKREDMRLKTTSEYVKKHHLPVTMLHDYGWPAVALPE